jgi:hypothetical protein
MKMHLTAAFVILMASSAYGGEPLPAEVASFLDSVSERGVPIDVVELKAREGLAKGVAPQQLRPILERLVEHLEVAQDVHEDADAALLSATASALRSGASASTLRRLGEVQAGARVRATETLGDLVRMNFSERDALRLTLQAAQATDPNAALIGISGAAASLVRSGLPSSTVAKQIDFAMDSAGQMDDDVRAPKGKAYGHDRDGGPADPKGKDK